MQRYHAEVMMNGFVRMFDRSTKSISVYNLDGTLRSGPSRLDRSSVLTIIAEQIGDIDWID